MGVREIVQPALVVALVYCITFKGTKGQCDIDCGNDGGFCIPGSNPPTCDCSGTDGDIGFNCEISRIALGYCYEDQDPCINGQCYFDEYNYYGWDPEFENGYYCDCSGSGWYGQHCTENIDECLQTPCEHEGVCIDNMGSFTCDCTGTGYIGNRCQNFDYCAADPCANVGVCSNGETDFTCDCTGTGYEGPTCELSDYCAEDPCVNGGVCSNGETDFTCDCTGTGYEGPTCKLFDYCDAVPCANNGACINGETGFTCDCTGTGYEGPTCEPSDYCATDPCANGGVCSNGETDFTCDCTGTGYEGPTCELSTCPGEVKTINCESSKKSITKCKVKDVKNKMIAGVESSSDCTYIEGKRPKKADISARIYGYHKTYIWFSTECDGEFTVCLKEEQVGSETSDSSETSESSDTSESSETSDSSDSSKSKKSSKSKASDAADDGDED